jgi:hypothetical protein
MFGAVLMLSSCGASHVGLTTGNDQNTGGGSNGTNGTNGTNVFVEDQGTFTESEGTCTDGGTKVDICTDSKSQSDDPTCTDGFITPIYICNGDTGAKGDLGDGASVIATPFTDDYIHCQTSGSGIELDFYSGTNLTSTEYVCNGCSLVFFPDQNLNAAIRLAINKPTGLICQEDLIPLTSLYAYDLGIRDLAGLEYCTSLTWLNLDSNQIADIRYLYGLTSLTDLYLSNNQIIDISALSALKNLRSLDLGNNQITDISALSGLTSLQALILNYNQIDSTDLSALSALHQSLTYLWIGSNQITDISALSALTSLQTLQLSENQISDITPLSGLTSLTWLGLWENQISDITPLSGLTSLRYLGLYYNPLLTDISALITNFDNGGLREVDGVKAEVDLRYDSLDADAITDANTLLAGGVNISW